MLELVPLEKSLFLGILMLSLLSGVLGYLQVVNKDIRCRGILAVLVSAQIIFAVLLLILRAKSIGAFPLTSVFESMLMLMVFVGITFLLLLFFIRQIWFLSVMVWVLGIMAILSVFVAQPSGQLQAAARSPWVIVHAVSMSLSGAMVVFAGAMGLLFLWSRRCLKNNQIQKLFGRMPTLDKLQVLNLLGLRLSFTTMTFGLVTGIGLIAASSSQLGMTLKDWLIDSKIVLIGVSWILLLTVLLLKQLPAFSPRAVAWATLIVCFLILFAFIGSQILCKSGHDFVVETVVYFQYIEQLYADHPCWS